MEERLSGGRDEEKERERKLLASREKKKIHKFSNVSLAAVWVRQFFFRYNNKSSSSAFTRTEEFIKKKIQLHEVFKKARYHFINEKDGKI